MDQRVYLRLENGEIVALEDGTVPGTSYVVEDGVLASTSHVVQDGSRPSTSYVVDNTGLQSQTFTDENVSGQEEYVAEQTSLGNIAVENGRAENVVYIVQHEGGNTEGMQYAVVGESDSIGTAFAIQAVTSDGTSAGSEKSVEYTEITSVQDMSGIETLSRVATQEFAGSILSSNSEMGTNQSIKVENSGEERSQNEIEGNNVDNISFSFYCEHCAETFEELTSFKLHLKTEHDIIDFGGESGGENELTLFPTCQLCSQTFVDAKDLEEHKKIHAGEFEAVSALETFNQSIKSTKPAKKGNFKCRFCDDYFDSKSMMHEHVANEHPDKKLPEERTSSSFTKCPYCHKMYVLRGSNKSLIKHIHSSHPGKSTEVVSTLAYRGNQLEEKMNCPFCDAGFFWEKSLIRHMKDEHPKILEETGDDIFAELGVQDLQTPSRRHRRSLNNEDQNISLQCPECPRKFLWDKSLRRHMVEVHNEPTKGRRIKKEPVVFQCPHCTLVSKYACAVRKHVERKHPEKVKGVDVTKLPLQTIEADAVSDMEFKTVDKRPAEVRLNFCPVIFRCPFCTYASKQSSNLLRHLTSVKHGNIFSHEELKEIGVTSFKVEQTMAADDDDEEKLDGTLNKRLSKLKLKGKLLDIVMMKYEILKRRKLENKENGIDVVGNEEDFSDMDIDNIINVAEDESEESFNEEEDDEEESEKLEQTGNRGGTRTRIRDAKTADEQLEKKNEKDNDYLLENIEHTGNVIKKFMENTKQDDINKNVSEDKKQKEKKSGQKKKSDNLVTDTDMIEILPIENASFENDSDIEVDIDTDIDIDTVDMNKSKSSKSEQNISSRKLSTDDKVTSEQDMSKVKGRKTKGNDQSENQRKEQTTVDTHSKSASTVDKVISVGSRKISLRSKNKPVETTSEISRKVNTKANSLMCEVCNKEFSNFTMFKEHLSSHVNIKVIFRCKECACEFSFLKDLKNHMRREHNRNCSENDIADIHTNLVKMNSRPVTTYDCPFCEMLFSQSGTLQQHIVMDHPDNIESACIKQEGGITSTPKANETVVLAFNCQYCECFFHNINDIVKHMHIVHRDVDRASVNSNVDSSVRKSGRKRRVPKWLEEASDESSPAKKTKDTHPVNVTQTPLPRNETPVSRLKGKKHSNLAGESNIEGESKKSKTATWTEQVEAGKEDADDVTKNRKEVETNDTLRTGDVVEDVGISTGNSQNKIERTPRRIINKDKKVFKKPEPLDIKMGSSETKDKSENQNKCPHCDFVARRSSALTFHINFKHANVIVDSADTKEQESRKIVTMSPKKTNTSDSPFMSGKNTEIQNKGSQDHEKPEDTFSTRKGMEMDKRGKTAMVFDKYHVNSEMKNSDKANSSRTQKSRRGIKQLDDEVEEMEEEVNNEDDYDIEFGDSDDDYKPDKDYSEDGDSDLDDLDDEDGNVDEGYSISVMLECPYCETGLFSHFSILETHVKNKHPEKASSFSIIDANTKVELDGTVKSSNIVHTCKYCKKRFRSRMHVRAHVINKHGKKLADTFNKSARETINKTAYYKCQFCNVVSESRENILSHINRQHPLEKEVQLNDIEKCKVSAEDTIKNLFTCQHCEKQNAWKQVILRHIRKEHPDIKNKPHNIICEKQIVKGKQNSLYQCVYCNWQYERRDGVLAHIKESHPDQPSVAEDDILEVDIADKVENNFQCPYCDLKSNYKRCIIRHVSRAHREVKGFTLSDVICLKSKKSRHAATEGLIYMCPYCDFDSQWKHCVVRHVDTNHADVTNFNPEAIPSEYRKRSVVNLDEDIEIENDKDKEFDYFKCPYCDSVHETKKGVVEHTLRCHPKKSKISQSQVKKAVFDEVNISNKEAVYKCPACESGSKWKKTVVLHVRKAHPELKKFRVELCQAEFTKNEGNTGDMYMCKLCNELFMTTRGVGAHCMHVHPNEARIVVETVSVSEKLTNVFKCLYCEHSSGWRKAIIKHVEIHHRDVKDFQAKDVICEIVREKELQGTGGFQCPYCNKVNHWKKSIIRHIKTAHPNERQDLDIQFNPAASVRPGGQSCRKSSKQINCLRCGTSCRSMEKMRKHFLSKHPKLAKNYLNKENTELAYDPTNGRRLDHVCVLCSAKYMWKKSLLVHVKTRHRDMYDVYQALDHVVDIVAGGTDDQGQVARQDDSASSQHIPVSKPDIVKKDTVVPEIKRCEQCNIVFKTRWDANVHRRLKHRKSLKNRFPCSKCSLLFKTQSLRLQHKIRRHRYQAHGTTLHCTIAGCKFRCKFHKVLQNHYSSSHNLKIPILGNTTFSTYGAEGSVRCEICLRSFSSADQLKQHVDLHQKRRAVRFQCGSCGEQFLTRNLRDTHIETFHFDKLEMCDVCGNLYTRANLKKHIKTHDDDQCGSTVCPYCDQSVTNRLFNRHVFNEHQNIVNCQCDICTGISRSVDTSSETTFSCSVCNQSFCQKPMVYVHSKLAHADLSKSKVFSCDACPQFFFTKRMKDAHCHEHHRKKVSVPSAAASVNRGTSTYNNDDPTTHVIHIGQDEGKQYLPKLSESSMNAVIKELLVFEKGAENPYKCLLCGRSFTKSKYIKLHIRRAHVRDEDQPYRCKVCGSGFVRLTEFRKHSRSHSDFRPYKCRYCEKAFKQQANLRDHYRVHTNSKEYECFICKTEFRQRGGLTSHVVFHDTLKPFKCMYCQKGYTTRGELSRHMQKYNKDHTDSVEKSYPCHICEETFPHYPMLLKHIDTHNPDKPFQCVVCNEKFSNYVSMYFHKVKKEHFLLEEIQEGVKDLEKRGRKFRAKRNSLKPTGPEIVYAKNQPITETIYIGQPDTYAEGEANLKPVEVIIEEFGQDQVVRVQENEPEHEELLSIAKQLTELSGFAESEFYTTKKNVHQEEDEIIKDMLDADDDVLANLSKQTAGNKMSVIERDRRERVGRMEQVDEQKDSEGEDYDYMPEIENDASTVESAAAGNEEPRYVVEADGQLSFSSKSIPTNMEELVSLVSQNTSVGNNEQVMAYQSEDGSVIYVCLPDDQSIKTEEVVAEEMAGESDMVGDNTESVIQEKEDTEYSIMEGGETAEELYEEANETVPDENKVMVDTETAAREEHPMETNAVDIIRVPAIERQADTAEILQTETTDDQTVHADGKDISEENEQMVADDVEPLEHNEIQMADFVTSEQSIPVTSEQPIFVANPLENSSVEDLQNQDYSIAEPNYGSSVITIRPQDTLVNEATESHEDLIRRSQLARHLTGNLEPFNETPKTQTRIYATEQELQSIGNEGPLVSQNIEHGENISQDIIDIATTASAVGDIQTNMVDTQVHINDPSSFEQVPVVRPGDSFVEGEETLVEYQIDESRFIKEELLDTDYAEMKDKDREVMFFSDNIYTYSQLEKKFICLHCGAKIATFKNLKNHIRRHAPLSARTHLCTFCPKKFVTKNELKRHLCIHTGERKYECKECGKKFLQSGHLQEHMRLHTGEKPFQCSECTAAFITKSQLVLHWSRLHSINEIPCNKCDKIFKTQIDLRRHKGLEHSGTKVQTRVVKEEGGDHVCDICGKSFNAKATLKRHLEKHNLENLDESEKVVERFACSVCGVSFKSKFYVKEHFKIVHTEEKSEICELCGMGFATKSLLRRHRESKHQDEDGNQKWFCNICNKSLGSKYAYGYHMGAKH